MDDWHADRGGRTGPALLQLRVMRPDDRRGAGDLARVWLLVERDLLPLKVACQDALRVLSRGGPSH
jgi:hypothetical protein